MERKKQITFIFSSIIFGSWLLSLVVINPPTAKLFTPIVPRASSVLTFFFIIAAVSSVVSVLVSWGIFSRIKTKMNFKPASSNN